jgi:hypothetical protein
VGRQYNLALHALGNPYHIGPDGTREDVVKKYKQWLWDNQERAASVAEALGKLLDLHQEHGQLVLVCHCAPEACHANAIRATLEWMESQEKGTE